MVENFAFRVNYTNCDAYQHAIVVLTNKKIMRINSTPKAILFNLKKGLFTYGLTAISFFAFAQAPVITSPVPEPYDVSSFIYAGASEEFSVRAQDYYPTDIAFNANGTMMFILGSSGDKVIAYDLNIAYDVSSATYSGNQFYVGLEESFPSGLTFSPDGTKMFVVGPADDAIVEYHLSEAYNITTALYAGISEEFSLSSEEVYPLDFTFNSDGTKAFIVGANGDAIVEYDLGTSYDISTAIYAGISEEFSIRSEESYPTSLTFNADGTKLFIMGREGQAVVEYEIGGMPYDVSTARYGGPLEEFSVLGHERDPYGFTFSSDGRKMFVVGRSDGAVGEYHLASNLTFPEGGTGIVLDIEANDGAGGSNDASVSYALEGPDASLFSIDANGTITFDLAPNFEDPKDEDLNNIYYVEVVVSNASTQTILPVLITIEDVLGDTPIFTNVGEGFDRSTALYSGNLEEFSVTLQEDHPTDVSFNSDGTKMFVIGLGKSAVIEYDLAFPYDVSTAAYAGPSEEFSVALQEASPTGLAFNFDGTKMFIVGTDDHAVVTYELGTAYDVSTAVYLGSSEEFNVDSELSRPSGLTFNSDGSKMFITASSRETVVEYDLGMHYDVSSAVYTGREEELIVGSVERYLTGLTFNLDGTKLFVIGSDGDAVIEYGLTTPYDLSTAGNVPLGHRIIRYEEAVSEGIVFNSNGTKMFVIGSDGDAVVEYNLASVVDYQENGTEIVIDIDAYDGRGGDTDVSVTYNLEGADASLFTIDVNGVITFNSAPNFDHPQDNNYDNVYEITIVADNTMDKSKHRVVVKIQDINDTPVFTYIGEGTYDVSEAVYSGVFEEFSIVSEVLEPLDLVFNTEGTKMFVLENGDGYGSKVIEYNLSSAFDASTAVYAGASEEFHIDPTSDIEATSLAFNSSGSKMYVIDEDADHIIEYNLTAPYDVSSALHVGASEDFYIGDEESSPTDMLFSSDGTKIFIMGRGDKSIVEYTLTTAYDVSTAVYSGETEEFSVYETTWPEGMAFSPDGIQLFVINSFRGYVSRYELSTAYDVSTAVEADQEYLFVGDKEHEPKTLTFNNSGTKMFILGTSNNSIIEYNLPTVVRFQENSTDTVIDIDANDGQGGAIDASVNYSLEGVDASWFTIDDEGNIIFNAAPDFEEPLDDNEDNTYELIVVAHNSADQIQQPIKITVYDVETNPIFTNVGEGYDVSTARFSGKFFELSENEDELISNLWAFTFSADGTMVYFSDSWTGKIVVYELGSAFDLSSAVLSDRVLDDDNLLEASGMAFNSTGTKLFMTSFYGEIVAYDLEQAYDLATATYAGTSNLPDVALGDATLGLAFNSDGTKMYIVFIADLFGGGPSLTNMNTMSETESIAIRAFQLSTSYDVASADYLGEFYPIPSDEGFPMSVAFHSNGNRMFVPYEYYSGINSINVYDLTKAFDVTTAGLADVSEQLTLSPDITSISNIKFSSNGTKMFVNDWDESKLFEYLLASTVNFTENNTEFVIDIDANDGQGGANDASVNYSLEGDDSSFFGIDSEGIISFHSSPDFETPEDIDHNNRYELTIVADNSLEKSKQDLVVKILDIATTVTSSHGISIPENTEGTIYTIEASDSSVTFSIGSSKDESLFTLVGDEVSFLEAPDFEAPQDEDEDNSYLVDVIATDASGNESTLEVTITIEDVDEIVPSITSASRINVTENTTGTIYTTTADEPVTFSLGNEKDEALFNLEMDALSFVTIPDFENPQDGNEDNNYLVDVVATDEAGNSSTLEVTITVTNVADLEQTLTFSTIEDQLFETGSVVPQANASSGLPVTFTIQSGPAKITDGTIVFTDMGMVEVVASQPGDDNYLPATPVTRNFEVSSVTGISEAGSTKIIAYPNPVKERLTIKYLTKGSSEIEVINAEGQRMLQIMNSKGEEQVDVSHWKQGIYYLILQGNGQREVVKIIKQ